MGWISLAVLLSSLAAGLVSLLALVWAGIEVYRTVRYAQKDAQAWAERLEESRSAMAASLEGLGERADRIAELGQEIHADIEDIADTWAELRSHPAVRAAGFVGRHRRWKAPRPRIGDGPKPSRL